MEKLSTKQKINNAFRELRKNGYFAKQDFWCCQTCAWNAITDEQAKKAVFYHKQDTESFDKSRKELKHPLALAWSGDCEEIVKILRKHDLKVFHDGDPEKRIFIGETIRKIFEKKLNGSKIIIYLHGDDDYELWITEHEEWVNSGFSVRGNRAEIIEEVKDVINDIENMI